MRFAVTVLLVLAAVAIALAGRARHSRAAPPQPAAIYSGLRDQALNVSVSNFPETLTANAWLVLVDMAMSEGHASLLAVADGTVSLYTSRGGGVIGLGKHESVWRKATALLASATETLPRMSAAADSALPSRGRMRFTVRRQADVLTAEASTEALEDPSHPLHRLFVAMNELLTAVRVQSQSAAR